MTALDAVRRATDAGLLLEPAVGGLLIRGPRKARRAFVALLRPVAADILRLLVQPRPERSFAEPCDECGRTDWRVSRVYDPGHRTCHDCLMGLTAMRARGVPI